MGEDRLAEQAGQVVDELLRRNLSDRILKEAGEAGRAGAEAQPHGDDPVGFEPADGGKRGIVLIGLAVADHEEQLRVAMAGGDVRINQPVLRLTPKALGDLEQALEIFLKSFESPDGRDTRLLWIAAP